MGTKRREKPASDCKQEIEAVTLHDILQLKRKRVTNPLDGEKCITGKYYRESVTGKYYREPVTGKYYRESVTGKYYREPVTGEYYRESVTGKYYRESVTGKCYRESVTGKYYRESVLAEANRSDTRFRPNTAMCGVTLLHDKAPVHK